MPTEPRYTIIDNETGRSIAVSTDELQVLYWLAENEAERLKKDEAYSIQSIFVNMVSSWDKKKQQKGEVDNEFRTST